MRFHAAKAAQHGLRSGNQPEERSSRAANAIALVFAAGVLAIALWYRGGELLHSGNQLYLASGTTVAFAIGAWMLRGVSTSGALAGAAVAFIFVLARHDLLLFWVLLVVFFVTLAATRVGNSRKEELKVAEGGRSASQVMANLGIAALLLAIPSIASAHLLVLAALAEVAADTTSSEIGAAFSGRTVLITSWKDVPAGTDGGISLKGTTAGILAALITAACAAVLGLVRGPEMLILVGAATGGMLVDSALGGTLERHGYLNNDVVNLLSTAAAAGIAWMS